MTDHSTLRSRPRRALSVGLASALTLGALGFIAPIALADDPVAAPTLRWLVSEQFRDRLPSHTFDGGASEDEGKVITFPNGVGSYNPNGAASISYSGSVTAAFNNPGTGAELYRVTIANPRIVIDSDGDGVLSAVVSSNVTGGDSTGPERVVVTTFDVDSDDWTDGAARRTLTATPDWLDVLPAGSAAATSLGITNPAHPLDGASFAPSFLGQLASGVRAHFYLTAAPAPGTETPKKPATITAEADPISVSAVPTTTETGVSVAVQGTGFSGESLAGDAGVYVGIAPSGGLPDVSTPQGMAGFAGAQWVPAGGIVNGALTATVTAPIAKLDPTTDYSVYTWQAHTHSTASQDTETPFEIDYLPEPTATPSPTTPTPSTSPTPTTPVKVATTTKLTVTKTRYGTAAKAVATVSAGRGTVTLTGHGSTLTAPVVAGKATFTLPKSLKVKSYTLTARYSGDATRLASVGQAKLTVSKAKVSPKLSVSKKPTSKKKGKATVTISGRSGVAAPTGTAYVKFTKGKASKTVKVKLSGGKKTVTVPALKKGTWKVSVKYGGDARYTALSYRKVTSIKVAK